MRELILLLGLCQAQEPAPPRPEKPEDLKPRAQANISRDFFRLAYNFYTQKDGGGNPNLDEEMTVMEPQFLLTKSLGENWTASVKFQADIISAASVEKGKRFPAGTQSGASGDKYFGFDLGVFYAWSDRTSIGVGASLSSEYDYQSTGAYVRWSHDTSSRNDTFSLRLGGYQDTLDLIRFDGMEDGTDTRTSLSLGLGWSHIFTPRLVGTLNWDLTSQSGFLSTPYNSVVAAGTEVAEVLPDSRLRNAVHARMRYLLFDDLAVEPGLGFYFDDWGASALNFEFAVHWEALPGTMIVRPWYRYHKQTELDYFVSTDAATIPEYRTQDSDMAALDSHTIGIKIVFPGIPMLGESQEFEIGVDYTMRSDNLDSMSYTLGWQWRF